MQEKEKTIERVKKKLESGFFGFWSSNVRASVLVLILLTIGGFFSISMLPKEAFPKINLGFVNITTLYSGVNPTDIDSLITEKIEKNIKEIDGVKKINSTSSVGISSIQVEVDSGYEVTDVVNKIKSEVDKTTLPDTVEKPNVTEINISLDSIFSIYLYGDENKFSEFDLAQKANILKQKLESNTNISDIKITPSNDYKIKVLIDKTRLEQLGISISQIANLIKINNRNTPIGSYTVGDLNYDFKFDGELKDIESLKNVVLKSSSGSFLTLGDISEIKFDYDTKTVRKLGFYEKKGFNYVKISIDKSKSSSIFKASSESKELIKDIFKTDKNFSGLSYEYTDDLSKSIIDDYKDLASTAIQTFTLVFLTILFFVSFRESLIASLILPLSFFSTFIYLYFAGYTLNTLVNFSLILSLTICIDTVIVIVEAASMRQKLGYEKKYAVLLAIKEYKNPLISGTLTTLAVFLPMLSLPGVMGKFLSYIPITVFSTLLAGLFIALTISSAVYILLAKEKNTYYRENEFEEALSFDEKIFLEKQREGKKEIILQSLSKKEKVLNNFGDKYFSYLTSTLKSKSKKRFIIFLPIIITILSFIFISPKIGFSLFPAGDTGIINVEISAKDGTTSKSLEKYITNLENEFSNIKEIENYSISVANNKINSTITLVGKDERKREFAEVEKDISEKMKNIEGYGFLVSVKAPSNGPESTGGVLGVKLIANDSSKIEELKKVTLDFERFFQNLEGTRNVKSSSTETPGQFIFKFDDNKLAQLGLNSNDILGELYLNINGTKAGSIKSDYEDNEIILKLKDFEENFTPEDLLNFSVNTKIGRVRIGDLSTYSFTKAVSSVERQNTKISITVGSDLEDGYFTNNLQPKIDEFVANYKYPNGISYEAGGENAENSELIIATFSALFIALFLMFFILVIQFKSYNQPLLILFSIILSLSGVNIGLFLTGTPYSLTFMIGFISLAGIVINNAIILIDSANKNIEMGLDPIFAIATAGKTRLQPILVTTITTALGVLPLALQGGLWGGLGYTIFFGIMAGSILTLFCIPLIYHNQYLKKNGEKKTGFIKGIFSKIKLYLRKIKKSKN